MTWVRTRPRNRYAGPCYHCGKRVEAGKGFTERRNGVWWAIHEVCELPKVAPEPPPLTEEEYRNRKT